MSTSYKKKHHWTLRKILRAYRRKWRRLSVEDRRFVLKFLGSALVIFILTIFLIVRVIIGIAGVIQHQDSDRVQNKVQQYTVSHRSVNGGLSGWKTILKKLEEKQEEEEKTAEEEKEESLEDNEEAMLLANVVFGEAGAQSDETQIAVASVILNRVANKNYPNSIAEVVYQSGQYEVVDFGMTDETEERAKQNAWYVYQNGSQIPSNVIYQSTEVQGSGIWQELDGEYFCYE